MVPRSRGPRKPYPHVPLDSAASASETGEMLKTLLGIVSAVRLATRSRSDLLLEVVALRHQLAVFQRQVRRPKLARRDRLFWI